MKPLYDERGKLKLLWWRAKTLLTSFDQFINEHKVREHGLADSLQSYACGASAFRGGERIGDADQHAAALLDT